MTRGRKITTVLLGATLLAGASGMAAVSRAATTAPTVTIQRVAGPDRYATSAATVSAVFPSGAQTVILATGANFPDALAATYLAGADHGPVLLVPPHTPLPAATLAALQALKPQQVIIAGLTASVGDDIAQAVSQAGFNVTRLGGSDRYQTMETLDTVSGLPVGVDSTGLKTAILATGNDFADALSGGPLSYVSNFPMVLTDGRLGTLGAPALAVLQKLGIGHVIVLGGQAAMNAGILQQLAAMGLVVTTLQGPDRSATAAAVAAYAVKNAGFSTNKFLVVAANDFPDALTASELAALEDPVPLLLVSSDQSGAIGGADCTFLAGLLGGTITGFAIGGPGVLSDAILQAVTACAEAAAGTPTTSGGGGGGEIIGGGGGGGGGGPVQVLPTYENQKFPHYSPYLSASGPVVPGTYPQPGQASSFDLPAGGSLTFELTFGLAALGAASNTDTLDFGVTRVTAINGPSGTTSLTTWNAGDPVVNFGQAVFSPPYTVTQRAFQLAAPLPNEPIPTSGVQFSHQFTIDKCGYYQVDVSNPDKTKTHGNRILATTFLRVSSAAGSCP